MAIEVNLNVQTLLLSAIDLKEMNPSWTAAMIEDYLTLNNSLASVAQNLFDIVDQVNTNTDDITTNSGNIFTNATNITTNSGNISTNSTNITTNATDISDHVAATNAHGALGNIIGNSNVTALATRGPVLLAVAVSNASTSSVNVTSADATAAPAVYDQTAAQTAVTLVNELKGDVNTLVGDVNDAIGQINDLLARLRSSGVLDT